MSTVHVCAIFSAARAVSDHHSVGKMIGMANEFLAAGEITHGEWREAIQLAFSRTPYEPILALPTGDDSHESAT